MGICASLLLFQACGSSSSQEEKQEVRTTQVKIVKAYRGDISTVIHATGTVSPNHETYIGPKVSGRIEGFFADEGDFVTKGNRLLMLEQVRFNLAHTQAKAAYTESTAHLKNCTLKLDPKKDLFEKGVVNREALDDMLTEVELARARADTAQSLLATADEDLKDSVLYAPFSGFIVERRMNTGEIFSTLSNQYVFHIVDTGTVKVEMNIFETKKQFLKKGEKVSVTVDAIPGEIFHGMITVVNPLIDSASRKFLVKIEIPNPEFILESGMFSRIQIPEEQKESTILVPAKAVIERNDKKVLFLVENKTAKERSIKIGLVTSDIVEVLDGVAEGEAVIVEGLYAVKDGTSLIISE